MKMLLDGQEMEASAVYDALNCDQSEMEMLSHLKSGEKAMLIDCVNGKVSRIQICAEAPPDPIGDASHGNG